MQQLGIAEKGPLPSYHLSLSLGKGGVLDTCKLLICVGLLDKPALIFVVNYQLCGLRQMTQPLCSSVKCGGQED